MTITIQNPHDQTLKTKIDKILNGTTPQTYFNTFMNIGTAFDIVSILERNGNPAIVLNMSYETAKDLAHSLAELVTQYESRTETRQ